MMQMFKFTLLILLAAFGLAFACQQPNHNPLQYPKPPKSNTIHQYPGGVSIVDSFHVLENPEDPQTIAYIAQENTLTKTYLAQIPYLDHLKDRVRKLAEYDRYLNVQEKAGWIYYRHNPMGKFKQPVLYRTKSVAAKPEVVFDPLSLSKDGLVSVLDFSFSENGRFLALTLSEKGSDWNTIRILDTESKELLSDAVQWVKFSGPPAWQGNDGFYINKFPTPTGEFDKSLFAKVFYHKVGTSEADDQLIYEDKTDSLMLFSPKVMANKWLIIEASRSTSNNAVFVKNLNLPSSAFIAVRPNAILNEHEIIGATEDELFINTNENASERRVVKVNMRIPRVFQELVPARKDAVLAGAWLANGNIVAHYLNNACSELRVFDMKGNNAKTIQLPDDFCTLGEFHGDEDSPNAYFSIQTFLDPTSVYQLDMNTLQFSIFREVGSPLVKNDYDTRRIWVKSEDDILIPAFVVSKKGTQLDGTNKILLYGYGGFNIAVTPTFRLLHAAFLDAGGVLVVACLRGGSEYGENWHQAGTKLNKQNVFDDFIAVAEHLIDEKYCSSNTLAISGASNGGLLVGAVLTQRPDLCSVALPAVGVLDMLRFNTTSGGSLWENDYGSPQNEAEFKALYKYSPVHNARPAKYPATMILTAMTDTRVNPYLHSLKFTAALQSNQKGDKPILLRAEIGAGHGSGKTIEQQIEETTDVLGFTLYNLGVIDLKK
jgi:prolyl oligopeptidase